MRKLGALAIVVAALLMYGAFHLEDLGRLFGGATYHAAFRDASGLAEGNEVRIAGVKVGKVTGVELASSASQTYVKVSFGIDDDEVRLGDTTSATIRIKTVLGQKYLALGPAGDGRLAEDGEIPLSRTASPFDVVQAVTGLADRFQQIDTKQLATAFDALSAAFADTPDSVRTSLDGLSRLTRTLSSRDAQLRELLEHAHGVSSVLAERDEEFRKLIADGDLLLAEVIKRRDAIHQLLVTTTALAGQLSGLVKDNRARLAPALTDLRRALAVLQRNRDNLSDTIATFAPFLDAFTNVLGNGRWFDSYLDGLIQPFQPGPVR
ncbi:MCE family protein [Actinoplanes sp. NPDC051470]|uniref:MCE family protein n=1 Tax=unclassified Actinoplanes TaxID=2626549 RepID=UPI0034465FA1